jgi:hypothetical protein
LILGVEIDLSDGGFDAHKHILTTQKPDSMVKNQNTRSKTPSNSPRLFKTVQTKYWIEGSQMIHGYSEVYNK